MTTNDMIIKYTKIENLFLDPMNPRLGRNIASAKLTQSQVLDIMQDWTLEELAVSFLESGFWPQEALIVVREMLYNKESLVVVEGNRRLAALILLKKANEAKTKSKKWKEIIDNKKISEKLFKAVPYIEVKDRKAVSAYLGFRHVTGIKEWNPAEKAQYIAKLIEEGLSYDDVRRKIGSKMPTVRQNYITFNLLKQMEQREDIELSEVEKKFSVLYLSLRTRGVQKYLNIDILAEPKQASKPLPKENANKLVRLALWLFGSEKKPPLFTDSRYVDQFGRILESQAAIEYLERTDEPRWEIAYRKAGGSEQDLINLIEIASDNIQQALTEVHLFKKSDKVKRIIKRLGENSSALLATFPDVRKEILKEMIEDAGITK